MAEIVLDVLSGVFLITGGVFGVLGGIGLLRFPDFYSRLHAAGITDTLVAFLIIMGLVLQTGVDLVSFKLLLILLFMVFTSPTASHALARAALAAELTPYRRGGGAADSDNADGDPPSRP
ncbi:MAG: monovalent cation/H(+) antiporter subunit G [Wenzhouxiangellaceae bacterium]